ncbi:nicotinate-nucleotide/dimethylbenzimidazole phosphoribosyltransferase [Kribbella flavida DSM 17836]|uniref:Nicotinate-nucleotide--dimethylbenzimidazole phosphoribosyltransferase n=1 Tax=Kribbella flavida (strain DSM 17836 / JCM 10339 / NBRC 14399) TaxID=479435 RepID=D2PNR3_KRIFD|nr:nicotinate-nucleotide--dimethylbenzimidazole phosphoribosyltransferase [Kribbella flavida]ADB32731.1 nicotinate-nucleotide/dimethylbenzimidazole phosphoribosyltransferase [Kribbella flavida DSM 17836]
MEEYLARIGPADEAAMRAATQRQRLLTKPAGSLGVLEDLSVRVAGMTGGAAGVPAPAVVAVFAADHGVHAQGVSPWPQEVTAAMLANFAAGGAAVNAFAANNGVDVRVVDVGVATDVDELDIVHAKVRAGTRDLSVGPALTADEVLAAVRVGFELADQLVADGYRCLLTGDMGIANTTASAALIATFTGATAADVTGRGTGIDDATLAHKTEVVRAALDRHEVPASDPLSALAAYGGLEHAALAGYILGGAANKVPVILDGVIAGAAALVAQALHPAVVEYCVAGHRSAEPGHAVALKALGLQPLVDLDLRLGEGTGAVLAYPILTCAVRALAQMATFESAGISSGDEDAAEAGSSAAEREGDA